MAIHALGVQHIHSAGEVGVSGGGTVALSNLTGGGGGGVGAELTLQIIEGLDLLVVTVHHQAEGILCIGGGHGVLLLTLGLGVHAADNHIVAGGVQTGHNGIPAIGDVEIGGDAQTLGDLLCDLDLEAGKGAGAFIIVDIGDPVALGADAQLTGVQDALQGFVFAFGVVVVLFAAGSQARDHQQGQNGCENSLHVLHVFHLFLLIIYLSAGAEKYGCFNPPKIFAGFESFCDPPQRDPKNNAHRRLPAPDNRRNHGFA